VKSVLDQGLISIDEINQAIRPNFRVLIRLGLVDPPEMVPYSKIGGPDKPWLSAEHKALARQAARESIVLLKNDRNLLPLAKEKLKSIAVIGPMANQVYLDWYSGVPPYTITPLQGISAAASSVRFADGRDRGAAANLAKSCDVAVVCVGNNPTSGQEKGWAKIDSPSEGREAVDRKSLDLGDEDLVKAVTAANPRTVLVLVSSFPYAINWSQAHVPAILHMAHGSQEEGSALADVLFGDYNPAGRLVQTWPKSLAQLPPMMDYDIRHGRTYMYSKQPPLYPFGFGLSYTKFAYEQEQISVDAHSFLMRRNLGNVGYSGPPFHQIDKAFVTPPDATIEVAAIVRNEGRVNGDEVAQLYVEHIGSRVSRPRRELRGFQRLKIKAGENGVARFEVPIKSLAYWNASAHRWIIEGDTVRFYVGGSSANLHFAGEVNVEAGSFPAREDPKPRVSTGP
jgi:beta-glucosidase